MVSRPAGPSVEPWAAEPVADGASGCRQERFWSRLRAFLMGRSVVIRVVLAALLMLSTPAFAQQRDLRAEIMSATQAYDFDRPSMALEVYRTLRGAGLTLSNAEMIGMAEEARMRGLPVEAVSAAEPLFPDGVPAGDAAIEYAKIMESLRRQAAVDLARGLEDGVKAAEKRASRDVWFPIAQAFAGSGKNERAVAFYYRALTPDSSLTEDSIPARAEELARAHRRAIEFYLLELRQQLEKPPAEVNKNKRGIIMLNLGISLFRLGLVDEARSVWMAIEGDGAVAILAAVWIGLADRT
jgi:tetratricopeptide (TPR) repeat protein